MALASEWGHFYDRSGKPVYEVPYADPKKGMRSTTLADARKLNLYPGVTSIIQCAAKPGLERWKREQVLLAALTLSRKPDEPETEWIKRVFQDSEEQARKAAEKGTEIHAAIERYFQYKIISDETPYPNICLAVEKKITEKYGVQNWSTEKSFASPLGFGCKIDLVSPEVIIDFKTKEFSNTDKRLAWDEHSMQLAANRYAAEYPQAKCSNVFVSTTEPGLVHVHEWSEDELRRAWSKFHALLLYWKADRDYFPL
jgi:hypothetical protein